MKLFQIRMYWLALILLFAIPRPARSQAATFQLDVKQSKLYWKGTKTVGSKHFGFLLFNSGQLNADVTGRFTGGKFSLDMRSITSTDQVKPEANKRVDNELKSVSFFEVATFPSASMEVKSILPAVKPGTFTVQGNLTIKNITKPITFLAGIQQNGNSLVATAQFNIDRIKWGIHQTKTTSMSDQFFSGLKDKLIADEIPINLLLIFKKR